MIDTTKLNKALEILRSEVGNSMKHKENYKDDFHELCEIAGRLKVLIKIISKDGGSKKLI